MNSGNLEAANEIRRHFRGKNYISLEARTETSILVSSKGYEYPMKPRGRQIKMPHLGEHVNFIR